MKTMNNYSAHCPWIRLVAPLGLFLTLHAPALAQAGDLDLTFGVGGKVLTTMFGPGGNDDARAVVALQPDGKLVAAGSSRGSFALVSYLADGGLDTGFGTGGRVTTEFGGDSQATAVAVLPDGRILAVGDAKPQQGWYSDFALACYLPDGSLDASFGNGGKVLTELQGFWDYAKGVAVQADGKIVVVGQSHAMTGLAGWDFAVVRYMANGALDVTFGNGGRILIDRGSTTESANAVTLDGQGRIVVVGTAQSGTAWSGYDNELALLRILPTGALDPTFGVDGLVVTDVGSVYETANAVAIDSLGRIVTAGYRYGLHTTSWDAEFLVTRHLANGALDPSFGQGGSASADFSPLSDVAYALLLTPGDGILAVGNAYSATTGNDIGLAAFTSAGALDPGFGVGGKQITDINGSHDIAAAAVRLADGRIVVAGTARVDVAYNDFCLLRYQANGALDASFGVDGHVTTDFPGVRSGSFADLVAAQADGKIVAIGSSSGPVSNFTIARYGPDGSLDTSFGNGGFAITDFGMPTVASGVVIQTDGRIVAVGSGYRTGLGFALARYNPDGSPDASFGVGGKVRSFPSRYNAATAVALQADGRIVVAGYYSYYGSLDYTDFAVARYNPDGTLDATFGNAGLVTTNLSGQESQRIAQAQAVAIQADGSIVVAGYRRDVYYGNGSDFVLVRYLADGSLDPAFGQGGIVTTNVFGADDSAYDLGIGTDGKIVVCGTAWTGFSQDFALARYAPNGTLDPTFGQGGIVTTAWGTGAATAYGIALQGDGRILAAGRLSNGSPTDFALARYEADGSLDASFGIGGLVTTDFDGRQDTANGIALQAGKILLGGGSYSPAEARIDFVLARYEGASSPQEAVQGLAFYVEELAAVGVVNQGVGRSLESKLETAIFQIDRNSTAAATNKLNAFMAEVNGLVAGHVLTPLQGQILNDRATFIVNQL